VNCFYTGTKSGHESSFYHDMQYDTVDNVFGLPEL
jgi:hypothetical protein